MQRSRTKSFFKESTTKELKDPQNLLATTSKYVDKIVDISQHKIPDIKEFVEDPEIKIVREEKEKEWKKREEEVAVKQIIEKEKQAEMKAEIIKNRKEIDGKKFTFDPNGGVIVIKNIVVEKLANDFVWAR